ncbi:MAG: hypothetical protein QXU79_04390 [Candidatus Micrarchaeaceae archaeon]
MFKNLESGDHIEKIGREGVLAEDIGDHGRAGMSTGVEGVAGQRFQAVGFPAVFAGYGQKVAPTAAHVQKSAGRRPIPFQSPEGILCVTAKGWPLELPFRQFGQFPAAGQVLQVAAGKDMLPSIG